MAFDNFVDQESEWLRVALHKWLDDKYFPDDTNIEASRVAAESYYRSLQQKTTDLDEIEAQMCNKLFFVSFSESFHIASSAAKAAARLIAQRIAAEEKTSVTEM